MPDTVRHPAIETFLAEVDDRLRRLPEQRRAAERDELAQHLDLLVAAYGARGLDADAAARAAVERFGRAERVGAELRDAWQRKPREYLGIFVWYAAFVVLAYLGLFSSTGDPLPRHLWPVAFNAAFLAVFILSEMRKRAGSAAKQGAV